MGTMSLVQGASSGLPLSPSLLLMTLLLVLPGAVRVQGRGRFAFALGIRDSLTHLTDSVDLCRVKAINRLRVSELREVCASAEYPREEWGHLLRQPLRDYIINKEFQVRTMAAHLAWLQGR